MAKRYHHVISYRLREIPVRQIKVWGEAQARRLDRTGVAELARSIRSEGLQNPPMVQRDGKNSYLLMSGQRRLAALKRLGKKRIPVLLLTKRTAYGLEDAKAASVIENIHRRNMNVRETAEACGFLAERMGKSKAAQSLGMSMVTFKKYHGFAGVPDRIKDLVPRKISRDQAIKLYIAVPDVARAVKVALRISGLDRRTKRRYIEALMKSPNSSHRVLLKKARRLGMQQKISLVLPKGKSRALGTQSRQKGMEPQELANKIVSDWLKKRGY